MCKTHSQFKDKYGEVISKDLIDHDNFGKKNIIKLKHVDKNTHTYPPFMKFAQSIIMCVDTRDAESERKSCL